MNTAMNTRMRMIMNIPMTGQNMRINTGIHMLTNMRMNTNMIMFTQARPMRIHMNTAEITGLIIMIIRIMQRNRTGISTERHPECRTAGLALLDKSL